MIRKFWPLGLYRVAGESMLPSYQPGDTLLGWRWFRPRVGQVVVARHSRLLVKRIEKIKANQIWLAGDNAPASTDSRQFGSVPREHIEALIIKKLG